MKQQYMVWILPTLLAGVFWIAGKGDAGVGKVAAQPVSAAASAPLAASEMAGAAFPQPIINVLVGGEDVPGFSNALSVAQVAAVMPGEPGAWDNSVRVALAEPVGRLQQGGGAASGAEAPQQAPAQQGSASQQASNVITLRIEIVIVTEESGVAQIGDTGGAAPTEAAGAGQAAGEGAAAQPQATPTTEAAQATPAPEAAPPGAEAAPTASATEGEGDMPPLPGGEGAAAAGEEAGGASSAPQGGEQDLLAMGEYLYGTTCANCHQLSGLGNTAYPPLKGSPLLIANDPTAAILMVLQGRGHMPAFANALTDQEIAAILSHERTAWGNSASVVRAEQVSQARTESEGQSSDTGATEQTEPGQTEQGQTEQEQTEQGQAETPAEGQTTDPPQSDEPAQPQSTAQPAPQATTESNSESNTQSSTTGASPGMVIPIEIRLVMQPPSTAGE